MDGSSCELQVINFTKREIQVRAGGEGGKDRPSGGGAGFASRLLACLLALSLVPKAQLPDSDSPQPHLGSTCLVSQRPLLADIPKDSPAVLTYHPA